MSEMDFSRLRSAMVSGQLRTNAVNDPKVLDALEVVPRERFVPASRAALAYVDIPVPLGEGRMLNAPLATARLIVESGARAGQSVLLVGAATGYAAAVLAELGCRVVALESDVPLAEQARGNLAGLADVSVVEGPLEAGHAAGAPYDIVLIDGAVEAVPSALWEQLREGGAMVCGLRDGLVTHLARGVHAGTSRSLMNFTEIESAPLPGFALPKGFVF